MTRESAVPAGCAAVAFLAGCWYLAATWRALGLLGFPLDDAWIHAQFARNLASGLGLSFNPGEVTGGSTSPLWSALVAVGIHLGLPATASALALGLVLNAAAAWLAASLGRRLTGSPAAALVAGLSVALSARMTWASVSGMEVPLSIVTLFASLLAYYRWPARGWLWGGLAALAGTARPELFPLGPSLAVHAAITGSVASGEANRWWRRPLVTAGAVFGAVVAAYATLNWIAAGTVLPSTFAAKSAPQGLLYALSAGDLRELVRSLTTRVALNLSLMVRFCFDQSQLLLAASLVGALAVAGVLRGVRCRPGAGLIAAFLAVETVLLGALAPDVPLYGQEGRYVLPLLALFFVLAAVGLWALARLSVSTRAIVAVAAVALLRLASQEVQFTRTYVAQVDNIERLQVAMGRWLAASTPADALVATNDIGAVAYFSRRRVLDLEGLVTPAILPYKRQGRRLAFIEEARPALLVVFPEWYPDVIARTDLFTPVYRISVPRVSAAHDALVVYSTPWGDQPTAGAR